MVTTETHRLGPRSILTPGAKFRVRGGPIWVTKNGDRIPMRARGVMTYRRTVRHPAGYTYIEATSNRDGDVVLHVSGVRPPNPDMPEMILRPYRIVSRVGVRRSKGVRG